MFNLNKDNNMKNILIATDFTDNSEKAYAYGAKLAKENEATITLYHSTSPLFLGGLAYAGFGTTNPLLEKQKKELRDAKAQMALTVALPVFEGVKLEAVIDHLENESEADNTITFVNSKDFDLVLAGASGKRDESSEFLENITNEVNAPVLIFNKEETEFKEILVTTNFKNLGAKYFKSIQELSSPYARLNILYVNTPTDFLSKEEYELEYKKVVNLYHLENTRLITTDATSAEEGILLHTKTGDFDLATVATQEKTSLNKFFSGSTTNDLLEQTRIPILSVNLSEHLDKKYKSKNMANLKPAYIKGTNQMAFL